MSEQHDFIYGSMMYSKTDYNDVYFIIPDVHCLYQGLVICRVQTCDKILAQLKKSERQVESLGVKGGAKVGKDLLILVPWLGWIG